MGRTLSIETGFACNNDCVFCYQHGFRAAKARPADPDRNALSLRLRWGIENGCDGVGFSGGEPTIRKDFIELIEEARGLGFGRISLTTNGRRFSNPDFVRQTLDAGLNSIGFSLHGPDSATHDALVGREGAFRQTVAGIENVVRIASEMDRQLDLNLFILVNKANSDKVVEICRLGRRLGIGLVVVQPIIYSKGNLSKAAGYSLDLDHLVEAIRDAAVKGGREGWRIKLFNLPPCFFTDVIGLLEHQSYPVSVFRRQDRKTAGESMPAPDQGYVRLTRCEECLIEEACPGLHQSLIPQELVLRMASETLVPPEGVEELWLAGTELMAADTLTGFLSSARRSTGAKRLRLYVGADSVAGSDVPEAALTGGADSLSLVAHWPEANSMDLARLSGSVDSLASGSGHPLLRRKAGLPTAVCVTWFGFDRRDRAEGLSRLAAMGTDGLQLALPWDYRRPGIADLAQFAAILSNWLRSGGPGKAELISPDKERLGNLPFRLASSLLTQVRVGSRHLGTHFFCHPGIPWSSLSVPAFAGIWREAPGRPVFALDSLPGIPICGHSLEIMMSGMERTGSD